MPDEPAAVEKPKHPLPALTTYELTGYRRQLEDAITSQRHPPPAAYASQPDGGWHMRGPPPSIGPGTRPDAEEVRGPLEHTRHLRMVLDLLPLAPAAPDPLVAQAVQAIKTLDDLGLVIRLV